MIDAKFACMECGKKFRSVRAAEKASMDGCPKCGGVDIDLAPEPSDKTKRERIRSSYRVNP